MTEAPLEPALYLGVSAPATSSAAPLLLPPRGFKPAGTPFYVEPCANPYTHRSRSTKVQKAGLAYEKKAKDFLRRRFGSRLDLGPWYKFFDGHRTRYCQPDAVVQDEALGILIVEIKLRFSDLAWWQLKELYAPVIRKYFQVKHLRLLCLCKSFDPAVVVPEIVPLIDNFDPRIEDCVYAQLWRP